MAPEIRKLADAFLQIQRRSASPPASAAATITAGLVWTRELDKREALRRLIRREDVQNALIFCNRKVEVDVLYKSLKRHGFSVGALHGDMDQATRFATLNKFKANELQLLVCSDVAARGLDIGGLSQSSTSTCPSTPRITSTASAAPAAPAAGRAFTIASADDARNVAAIEKLTGMPIPRIEVEGLDEVSNEEIAEAAARPSRGRGLAPRPAAGVAPRVIARRATAAPNVAHPSAAHPNGPKPPRSRSAPSVVRVATGPSVPAGIVAAASVTPRRLPPVRSARARTTAPRRAKTAAGTATTRKRPAGVTGTATISAPRWSVSAMLSPPSCSSRSPARGGKRLPSRTTKPKRPERPPARPWPGAAGTARSVRIRTPAAVAGPRPARQIPVARPHAAPGHESPRSQP